MTLAEVEVSAEVWNVFPNPAGPNDQRDARILAALHAEGVALSHHERRPASKASSAARAGAHASCER